MISVDKDELDGHRLIIKEGDLLEHRLENGEWEQVCVEYGMNTDTGQKSPTIGFYTLRDGRCFIASVMGKLIPKVGVRFKSVNPN